MSILYLVLSLLYNLKCYQQNIYIKVSVLRQSTCDETKIEVILYIFKYCTYIVTIAVPTNTMFLC